MEKEWNPSAAWAPRVDGDQSSSAEVYDVQRAKCPLSFDRTQLGQGIWHAFRAADVAAIVADPATFSSAVPKYGKPLIPIELDPPQHAVFRRLLTSMMAPRRIARYEEQIRPTVVAELAPLIAAGGGDFVPLTNRLPMHAFCLLVGEEDASTVIDLEHKRRTQIPPFERGDKEANEQRAALLQPLEDFCRDRLRARRGNPRDDLASDIINGEINGAPINEDDATRMLTLVYIAGHDTTAMGMQGAISMLAKHPDQQEMLRADPSRIPAAVEECLRLEPPLHTLPRYCIREVELGGRTMRPGEQVYPVFGAANVDPEAFADPASFNISRKPAHFSFGRGIHSCPGSPLARLEIKVLLHELLSRSRQFSTAGTRRRKAWPRNGFTELPISIAAL